MNGKTVAARVHDLNEALTSAGRRAARGLLGNYPLLGLAPVAEFAEGAGVSSATIVRFVAQLGFRSYPDFQRALREELEERSRSPLQRPALATEPLGTETFLGGFMEQSAQRLRETTELIPAWEFDAVCQSVAQGKGNCYLAGWYQTTTTFGATVLPPQGYWNYFLTKVGSSTSLALGIGWSNSFPQLSVTGEIGVRFALEYVHALLPGNSWEILTTNTLTSNPLHHTDTNSAGSSSRFYRARLLP